LDEFKVESANMTAEYGRTPNVVSATMKSGTNAFHGTVFEFLRNDTMDARNFFAGSKNALKRNQFGGTIGGPIKRNKIFVFADIERSTQRQGIVFNNILPTDAMRAGNFSGQKALTNPAGGGFAGNVIPTSQISPQATYFLKYMPTQTQGSFNAPQSLDIYKGDIKVDVSGLPPGFSISTPIVIQAGHLEAKGTINAGVDAPKPNETNAAATKLTASAIINGQEVIKEVNNLGKIQLAEKPKLFVSLEPYDEKATNFVERSISDPPLEITVIPGQSIPAWLKVKRNGHDDLVTFSVEGLPHGVIVDNIGLNGVLIPKGEDARQIFLTTAKWVPDVDRFCFAKAAQAENQTSLPVLLHVRRGGTQAKR